MEFRKMVTITLYARQKKRQMYRTVFWTLWEKVRVGWSERTASKHVYYQVWNRSPAQVGCMRQVLRAGALGRPRGMGWGGMWEGGSGWGTHVNPWLLHVNVWQEPLQYCKVISLQLIKINGKKKEKMGFLEVVVVQLPSHVWFPETSWTAALQASLSLTISRSLPKFMSIALVVPSSHLIPWHSSPSSPLLEIESPKKR